MSAIPSTRSFSWDVNVDRNSLIRSAWIVRSVERVSRVGRAFLRVVVDINGDDGQRHRDRRVKWAGEVWREIVVVCANGCGRALGECDGR